jgi:hypothetical protein
MSGFVTQCSISLHFFGGFLGYLGRKKRKAEDAHKPPKRAQFKHSQHIQQSRIATCYVHMFITRPVLSAGGQKRDGSD